MGVELRTSSAKVACLDPVELHRYCLLQDPPLPVDHWWGKANYFGFGLGLQPGEGMVLLKRGDILLDKPTGTPPTDKIYIDEDSSRILLTFSDGSKDATGAVNLIQIAVYISGIFEVTPGFDGDDNAAIAVMLTDERFNLKFGSINRLYNHCFDETDANIASSSDKGNYLAWSDILDDIGIGNVGTAPSGGTSYMPDTVDLTAKPHNLSLFGSFPDVAEFVLSQLGCTSVYNPIVQTGPGIPQEVGYKIVRIGDDDAAAQSIVDNWKTQGWLVWDERPKIGKLVWNGFQSPRPGVAVFFRIDPMGSLRIEEHFHIIISQADDGTLSVDDYYPLQVEPPPAGLPDDPLPLSSCEPIFDALSARVDTTSLNAVGTYDTFDWETSNVDFMGFKLLNWGDLKARALKVAKDYFDEKKNFNPELLRIIGRLDPAVTGEPAATDWTSMVGPVVSHFVVEDVGDGVKLSVKREGSLKRFRPKKAPHGSLVVTEVRKTQNSQSYSLTVDLTPLVDAINTALNFLNTNINGIITEMGGTPSSDPINLELGGSNIFDVNGSLDGGAPGPVVIPIPSFKITRRWMASPLTIGQRVTDDIEEYDSTKDEVPTP